MWSAEGAISKARLCYHTVSEPLKTSSPGDRCMAELVAEAETPPPLLLHRLAAGVTPVHAMVRETGVSPRHVVRVSGWGGWVGEC
jgi:hypothetical protein